MISPNRLYTVVSIAGMGKHIAAVAATLSPEVVATAQERGRVRDLDAAVTELLVELGE